MSTHDVADRPVPGTVARPPAPGAESAGPPLVDLVQELRATTAAAMRLFADARRDVQYRFQQIRAQVTLDANGDGAVILYQVPQGASAALTWLAVDEASVTPANPDTSANLWHAIYAGPPGSPTAVQVAARGALLDCRPTAPGTDAQIPTSYIWGDQKAAPRLVGPECFWFVIDAGTANAEVFLRGVACVEQPG